MDSPESFKLTATNCETSSAPQDSPVFDFLSNLSPIQPLRGPAGTQSFQELNSPPLVFTSPRLNRHRPSTFLKRAQFPRASSENIVEDDRSNVSTIKGYRKQDIQLTTRLDVCNEKGTESEGPENDLTRSPTEFPEQFLNDIVNLDSVDPNFINNSCSETRQEENVVEGECKSNSRTSERIETEDVRVLEGITLTDKCEVEKDTKQQSGVSFGYCPEADRSLTNQLEEDLLTENVEANQSYHVLPGKENEVFVVKAAGEVLTDSSLKKGQNDHEAFQHRGMRRRCLMFEDAQHKLMSTPINRKNDEVTRSMLSPRNSLNSSAKIPIPSGIGLHLNSIVNAAQAGPVMNVLRTAQRGKISIVGAKKSLPVNDSHVSEYSNSSPLPLVESVSESIDDNGHENYASVGVTSPVPLSTYIAKPSAGSIVLNSTEDQSISGNKRKSIEIVDDLEEFNESSPQMKRMKSLDPKESDGCKRCNCKKSKCLKLYCDCFAAGIYCAGPCSCQGCYNKPEYEDKVIETRQKIESRDPLAFAPRVVKHVTEQPSDSFGEDGANFTPSSARHKRGCKCKKSMCLKKYCECYQSNVGCSDGCRCEGCQNVFGQKGVFVQEYCPIKDLFSEEDTNEANSSIPEKIEGTLSGNNAALSDADNLTPPTSALQLSNHGNDASKAWFPSDYSPQSSESNFTYAASPYMVSSDNNTDIVEILDLSSFNDEDNLNPHTLSGKTHYYPTPGTKQLLGGAELSSNSTHDETPEILKDGCTPHNGVKVCSPNKKRISPPHGRPHEFGSCSSTGIRTGRKFILKAVPSFPPLTPCIDSRRGNECQNQGKEK